MRPSAHPHHNTLLGNPANLQKFCEDVQKIHGVDIETLQKHDFFGLCMSRHYLDPFHAIARPGGNVFILNLAKLLKHRGSFPTFVKFLKGVRVPKGGGLWVRVRFGRNGQLYIISDAGENFAFSLTDPQDVLGPDYTKWSKPELLRKCAELGVDVSPDNETQKELATKLNSHKATEQGWLPEDRLMICEFFSYGIGFQGFALTHQVSFKNSLGIYVISKWH